MQDLCDPLWAQTAPTHKAFRYRSRKTYFFPLSHKYREMTVEGWVGGWESKAGGMVWQRSRRDMTRPIPPNYLEAFLEKGDSRKRNSKIRNAWETESFMGSGDLLE